MVVQKVELCMNLIKSAIQFVLEFAEAANKAIQKSSAASNSHDCHQLTAKEMYQIPFPYSGIAP